MHQIARIHLLKSAGDDTVQITMRFSDGTHAVMSEEQARIVARDMTETQKLHKCSNGFLITVIERHTSPPRSLRIFPPIHLSQSWIETDDHDIIDKVVAMAAMLDQDELGVEVQKVWDLLQPVAKS